MTTDELLEKLPCKIGNHKVNGKFVIEDEEDEIGCLVLRSTGSRGRGIPWIASYGDNPFVCLNPLDPQKRTRAVRWGETPNEALQALYNWCVENKLIND